MIAQKLHKLKKKIRRKAKKIGLYHLKVRPPFLPPYFPKEVDQKTLHLIARTNVEFKPLAMNEFENWLQKELGLKIFIETKDTLRISAKKSPFIKKQDKLFSSSSIVLRHIKKDKPLDEQWQIQFHNSQQEEKTATSAQDSARPNQYELKNIYKNGHGRINKEKRNVPQNSIDDVNSQPDITKISHNWSLWKKHTAVNCSNGNYMANKAQINLHG